MGICNDRDMLDIRLTFESYDLGVIGGSVAASSFVTTFNEPDPNEV